MVPEHSPFHGMKKIEDQFDCIEERGTRIVIWNLRKIEGTQDFELDFDRDPHDILLSEGVRTTLCYFVIIMVVNGVRLQTLDDGKNMDSESNEYLTSLKMYLKILYMVPKMKIILRGEPVK